MITGWITNNSKVIECNTYDHFKVDDPIITKLWEDKQKELDEIHEDCSNLSADGEHPEWHVYEIAESNAQYETYRELYARGFVRLAPINRYELAAQGTSKALEAHKYVLKELADKYHCEIKIIKRDNSI